MNKIIFYKEKSTGKCIPSNLSLPSDKYIELKPNTTDAATEKHIPVYKIEGNDLLITIGSTEHPMTEEHFIDAIILITSEKTIMKKLKPGDSPIAEFNLTDGEKINKAFAYCNLHGLWVKEI